MSSSAVTVTGVSPTQEWFLAMDTARGAGYPPRPAQTQRPNIPEVDVTGEEVREAESESLFRAFNERLRAAVGRFSRLMVVCECGRPDCTASIKVESRAYEAVRSHGDRFIVRPGHNTPSVETVVEQTATYWVVEKVGLAGDVAEDLDPRS